MKKIYKYRARIFVIVLFSILLVLSIITGIVGTINGNEVYIWIAISGCIAVVTLVATGIACKYHIPIYYDLNRVKYRDKEINWKDVRITAYACLTKSWQYGYFLVFSNQYLIGNDLKNAIKEGFCVYLYFNTLQQLLEYYDYEIKIVEPSDMYNYVKVLRSNKKTNKLFNEHNAKCYERFLEN